jgi:hypothetical protein
VDLQALPDDVKVRFVLGGKQGTLPTVLAVQAQSMGTPLRANLDCCAQCL